jgi:D-sedoheptulose 7-phosphate isomerase
MDQCRSAITKAIDVYSAIRSDEKLLAAVEDAAESVCASFHAGGKLLLAGNGGSAADAQHIAAEFVRIEKVTLAPQLIKGELKKQEFTHVS